MDSKWWSRRWTLLFGMALGLVVVALAVPAVAWARSSPRTEVHAPVAGSEVYGPLRVAGSASHRTGVAGVRLVIKNLETGAYWSGSAWQPQFVRFAVPVDKLGSVETAWSYTVPAADMTPGPYRARAFSYSVEGNGDGYGGARSEFVYGGRLDPALYHTEIVAPTPGSEIDGPIVIEGEAWSTEGVESVRVVVRNVDTGSYWNADREVWQSNFTTVQAELSSFDGGTHSAWTVALPADRSAAGSYRARAWVRTASGKGDPFGHGRTHFTVTPSEPPPSTTTPPTSVGPTTTAPPSTTIRPTTTTIRPTTTTSRPTTTIRPTTTTSRPTTSTVVEPSPCRGGRALLEPCGGVLLGASGDFTDASGNRVNKQDHFAERERQLGADFDIYHDFLQWDDLVVKNWPNRGTKTLADEGHILFLNWKSPSGHPRDWASIANGSRDEEIRTAADRIVAFGEPLFITFFHEPEDNIRDASGGDPAVVKQYLDDYSAAFRQIHDVFDQTGADNVAWVWNVQGYLKNWEGYYEGGLYPGDDVIDWVGFNNYNWFNCHDTNRWRPFTEVVAPFYDWLEEGGADRPATDKPIFLGEFGSEENTGAINSNETKGEWLDEARRVMLTRFPRLKAAVYFDTEGRRADGSVQFCQWALDSSRASMAGMRALLQAPDLDPVWPVERP